MALRKPGIGNPNWLFQDFLYFEDGAEQQRYIQVKYDGEPYTVISETFDYSNPPYSNALRLAVNYIRQCLYPTSKGYVIRVNKDAYAFWVSEQFKPVTNLPDDYLYG